MKTLGSLFLVFLLAASANVASIIEESGANIGFQIRGRDPLSKMIGSAKEAVGDTFFLKADEYFHGGVKRFDDGRECSLHKRVDQDHHNHDDSDKGHNDEHSASGPKNKDWIENINSKIRVHSHEHLADREAKELLPLLNAAVQLDPYNTTAVLTTAYWLESRFGKINDAIRVLERGRRYAPEMWEIDYRLGKIYFKYKKNYGVAEGFFLEALRKSRLSHVLNTELVDLWYHLAESYRLMGDKSNAVKAYRETLNLLDENEHVPLKQKIAETLKTL